MLTQQRDACKYCNLLWSNVQNSFTHGNYSIFRVDNDSHNELTTVLITSVGWKYEISELYSKSWKTSTSPDIGELVNEVRTDWLHENAKAKNSVSPSSNLLTCDCLWVERQFLIRNIILFLYKEKFEIKIAIYVVIFDEMTTNRAIALTREQL